MYQITCQSQPTATQITISTCRQWHWKIALIGPLASDGFPPPLELPFSHQWVSNWVSQFLIFSCFDTYGLCGGEACGWHYSSVKFRILDCVSHPNFIITCGGREQVINLEPDLQRFITTQRQNKSEVTTKSFRKLESLKWFGIGRRNVLSGRGIRPLAPLPR